MLSLRILQELSMTEKIYYKKENEEPALRFINVTDIQKASTKFQDYFVLHSINS